MTITGPDISSYQHGANLGAISDPFVIAKTTEGTYYTDADYQGWRQQAAATGKLFAWYHFLSGEDAHAQVAHTLANIGDASLPGMLDFEPTGTFRPTFAQALAYVDAALAAGLKLRLVYFPHWYWQEIGSPDLSPLAARGVGLVSSAYPGGSGYPGDNAAGWQPYGGMTPTLYQYTDVAVEGGQRLGDMNAYKGDRAALAAFLDGPSTPTGGSAMGTIPPSIGQKYPEIAGEFPAGASFTDETALIWADGGARAAALYSRQARDAVNSLAAHMGAPPPSPVDVNGLAAALGPLLHPSTDVNALAAALEPHLAAGATADQVAAAVTAHMAADLAKG